MGGLYSPRGIGFVGSSVDRTQQPLVIAIRRIVLEEKMVRAADERAGAHLVEEYPAGGLEFRGVRESGRFATREILSRRFAGKCWLRRMDHPSGLPGC